MRNISDKVLGYIAYSAKKATYDAMGLASRGYGYEPKMPESINAYKVNHTSKIEKLFNKLTK